jgi:protein phosphatase
MTQPISATDPRPTEDEIDVVGLSHVGRVRRTNQDHFLIASLHRLVKIRQTSLPGGGPGDVVSDSRGFLCVVADGVGGSSDGERASGTALRALADHAAHAMRVVHCGNAASEAAMLDELRHAVLESHARVRAAAESDADAKGMATTMTLVGVVWPRAFLVQVGDSRCYRLRDGGLEQVSTDQTMAQAMLEAGIISPEVAKRSQLRNVLASAIGGDEAMPQTFATDVRRDDVMLLCTDGLTKHVTDEEIAEALRAMTDARSTAQRLVDLALERGGTDNVTVIVGRMTPAA